MELGNENDTFIHSCSQKREGDNRNSKEKKRKRQKHSQEQRWKNITDIKDKIKR